MQRVLAIVLCVTLALLVGGCERIPSRTEAKASARKAYEEITTGMPFREAVHHIESHQLRGVRPILKSFFDTNGTFIIVWQDQYEHQIKLYVENERVQEKGEENLQ